MAAYLGVPVSTVVDGDGASGRLPREQFYIPGSVLRVSVDATTPLGFGFEPEVDVFFDNSPAFLVDRQATAPGIRHESPRRCARTGPPVCSGRMPVAGSPSTRPQAW